jgi:phospholipid/cholesterol/gamma-HCH transport system substrate-binding protein
MRSRRWLAAVAVLTAGAAVSSCTFPGGVSGGLTLTAVFDDVGDLVTQHSVQMADVRIGSVEKIELTDDFKAEVTLGVKSDVKVPKRSVAMLRTTSLLGEKFIELRPEGEPDEGPFFEDGDRVEKTGQAPELEFVAEKAIEVLGAVVANDVAALVETGAVGFGERGPQLKRLISDLSVVSRTLASRSGDIVDIIDGLDRTTAQLADGSGDIDALLTNLSRTTTVLSENRERAINALASLTRLAKVQNDNVLDPFKADIDRQVKQVDAIVAKVTESRAEVANLVDWIDRFVHVLPQGIPDDQAQVYSWFVDALADDRVGK